MSEDRKLTTQTLTFQVMYTLIQYDENRMGNLNLDPWLQALPEELRSEVSKVLEVHVGDLRDFLQRPANDMTRREIVQALQRWCMSEIPESAMKEFYKPEAPEGAKYLGDIDIDDPRQLLALADAVDGIASRLYLQDKSCHRRILSLRLQEVSLMIKDDVQSGALAKLVESVVGPPPKPERRRPEDCDA